MKQTIVVVVMVAKVMLCINVFLHTVRQNLCLMWCFTIQHKILVFIEDIDFKYLVL